MQSLDTTSYWIDSASLPRFPKLDSDMRVDVVIVGGGITGLTSAYLLSKAGRSVALIERGRLAQIDTAHTSAHLTMVTDERLSDLVSRFGEDHARAVWDAGLAAIGQIDTNIRDESIDCDFGWAPGYLHRKLTKEGQLTKEDSDARERFQRDADLAATLGFDVTLVDDVPLVGGPGLRFEDQARFHPRKYLAGLARAVVERGGQLYEHSAADEFCAKPLGVKSNGHTLSCEDIVIATHNPLAGNTSVAAATLFQTKLALYTSYVVAGRVKKGVVPDALLWDTDDPYHYFRVEPHRDHDVVIFGGADHKTGQSANTRACFAGLEETLTSLVPEIEITHRWSGQVIETPDGLPYIGETAEHQVIGTGFSGNGMTFGTLTAMMARDRIAGQKNPWVDLFDPGRKALRSAWDYVRENTSYPYYLVRDRFAGAEGKSLRAVRRGQGRILELNGERVAAYRADDGSTIVRSAICTHLGCVVEWNDAERTWDCPCHGSRFRPDGSVIAGPAESPLGEVKNT